MLHPARTLLEKLVHISDLARRLVADETLTPDPRSGRHFYDVHQLLGDNHVLAFLEHHEQALEVVENIDEITRQFFSGDADSSARPDGGFAASAAFDLSSSISAKLRLAYETTMSELYFGADPLPEWDEICHRVARCGPLL